MPLGGCSPGWHHKKFASQQMKMNLWCAHIKQNFLITVSSMNWFSSSVLTRERLGKRGTRTCPVLNFLFLRGENWFLSLGAPFMTPVSCIMDLSLQVDCYRKKNQSRSVRSCSWIPTDHNFMFLFTVFISKIYIFCSRISIFIKTLQKTTNQKICFCLNMIQISKTKDKEIPTYLISFVDYEKNFQYKKISEPKCLS